MFLVNVRKILGVVVFSVAAVALTQAALAQDVKIPQTAAEHEARAKAYREQTAHYRSAAAEHKQMAVEYSKQHPPQKGSPRSPLAEKMSKHCKVLVSDYEKLAEDAQKAADYHEMRAKELHGG